MEPITLCGAVIVAFGLWIEFEAVAKRVVNAIGNGRLATGIMSLFSARRPAYVNRYAPYTR